MCPLLAPRLLYFGVMNGAVRIALTLVLALAAACSGEFVIEDGSDLNGGGGGGGGGGADAGTSANGSAEGEAFFRANILPLMSSPRPLQPCALCHQGTDAASGPIFLGLNAEANYQGILSAGLIGPSPLESRLYTRGVHAGDAFPANESLLVAEWIRIEANP